MSTTKFARSNSARPTKFLGLPHEALGNHHEALGNHHEALGDHRRAFSLALCLLSIASLLCVTTAAAEPTAESVTKTDRIAESSASLELETAEATLLGAMATTDATGAFVLAQSGGDAGRSRPLEPRYQPREPEPESWYNGSYVFALTRGVADSTIAPAGQVPLYVLTVPLDIAFLPFALIGGLFG